jgi:formate dehydrogenase major subunit
VIAVQVRRTNHYSDWQARDREESVSLRQMAKELADAAE